MSKADNIFLGDGIFAINGKDVARTRGGGQFTVEREYRDIEADGDYGPVRGRQRKTKSTAKLIMNLLTIISEDLATYYPATTVDTQAPGTNVWNAKEDIEDSDYQNVVSWTGFTKGGKQVHIEIQNAINLENIDWTMVDKEEIVPQLSYTATYDEDNRKVEPWNVEVAKGDTYKVTLTVKAGGNPVIGASVRFYNTTLVTDNSGEVVFDNIPVGNNQEFKVVAGGHITYFGAVDVVSSDVSETVNITAI